MKVRAYITHKAAEHYTDCQDRFCINKDKCAIAVSDGVSQSIFSGEWAGILVRYYADNCHCDDNDRKQLCCKWKDKVTEYIENEKAQGRNPWRVEDNMAAERGAGATICGVRFCNDISWEGHVLGDSCIIEINITDVENPLIDKIISSEDAPIGSSPDFYDSFPQKEGRGQIKEFKGEIGSERLLLLVSDPFSSYFYKHKEECAKWLKEILKLDTHEDYCRMVEQWRKEGLPNDDSTLCIVEYNGSNDFDILHEDDIEELSMVTEQNEDEDSQIDKLKKDLSDKLSDLPTCKFKEKVVSILSETIEKINELIGNKQ